MAALLASCVANLTPAQRRAWDAFQDCRAQAPTAEITNLPPEGGIYFRARGAEVEIMSRCLKDRHGYPVR